MHVAAVSTTLKHHHPVYGIFISVFRFVETNGVRCVAVTRYACVVQRLGTMRDACDNDCTGERVDLLRLFDVVNGQWRFYLHLDTVRWS